MELKEAFMIAIGFGLIGGILDKRVERRKYEAEDKLNKYDIDAL